MADNVSEVSVFGKWIQVPSLTVGDKTIVITGRWIKKATVRSEAWLETELENPDICIQRLKAERRHGVRADIFTFTQKIPGTPPKYDYCCELESIAAVRITSFNDWWEGLPQEARKNVRRAEKRGVGIVVRPFDDDLIRGIASINDASSVRQGVRNYHYGKSFEQVKKDHASFIDRSDFLCAYFGDEMIGYLKLVHRGEVSSILNLATKASHYDKRPANALIAKAMEICGSRGVSYLTYGLFNYGNKGDSPLRQFKIRNGFQEIMLPRFYIPLTPFGTVVMKLKVHRGMIGILPHSVITLAANIRRTLRSLQLRIESQNSNPTTSV